MMKLTIELTAKENEHVAFIEALESILDDIKGGIEKHTLEGGTSGSWSIDPLF